MKDGKVVTINTHLHRTSTGGKRVGKMRGTALLGTPPTNKARRTRVVSKQFLHTLRALFSEEN